MMKSEELHERILQMVDVQEEISDGRLQEIIYEAIKELGKSQYIPIQERMQIGKELFQAFRKLDFLQDLIEDDSITEIMINGTENIFIEKAGRLFTIEKRFWSREKLENIIQQIVGGANRLVNEASPIVDTRLEDGSRVNVVLYPIALNGPIVTIRKFSKHPITIENLIAFGSMSEEVAVMLEALIKAKYNILISGGTGSGKTTMLNALSGYIPETERIITIEDNAELQLNGIQNLVQMEARMANVEGEGEISIRQLIRTSLRMRPNRIIVGEVRGDEVIDMLMAMNTGHDGSLTTAHANTPQDMLSRLEMMTLMGLETATLGAIRRQIASALDIIVHVGRLRDGSRKVLEISELMGLDSDSGEIQLRTLYRYQEREEAHGKIQGEMLYMNPLYHKEKLLAAGYEKI